MYYNLCVNITLAATTVIFSNYYNLVGKKLIELI